MRYNIMCGGIYTGTNQDVPKHLVTIKGERLVDRTIRLLKERGITDICITISDPKLLPLFSTCDAKVLVYEGTTYIYNMTNRDEQGYWCDGFHDFGVPTCYLFGDVYFSEHCIDTIINSQTDDILFFGSAKPFAQNYIRTGVEPYGFKVVNRKKFFDSIKEFMRLQDAGKFWRKPIAWDLWAVIRGYPVEYDYFLKQTADIFGANYVPIYDYTTDVDHDWDIPKIEEAVNYEEKINTGTLKKVFGIISYLPEDDDERDRRKRRLERLFDQLGTLWPDTPILIVTQNWKRFRPKIKNKIVRIDFKEGLGIMKAREVLRQEFLKLKFDYLIMFDDDAIIECDTPTAHLDYMNELDKHPDGFCLVKKKEPSTYLYADSQLNLCAVSRYIYAREPLPDVDPQKGEAFEDRVWSCLLHNKYGDREFDCPQTIRCIHFKNDRIADYGGEVPSTWAHTAEISWRSIRQNTADLERYIEKNKELPDLDRKFSRRKIDLVVPFVDNTDPNWQRVFKIYAPKNESLAVSGPNRYRANDELFRYFFRCVDQNLPWINKIHLLVQNDTEVPEWIDRSKVHVVHHDEFIPCEYLPAFNSCTIEMFLWNIPELSEKFLYANDDFFVLNQTMISDWFTPDGKVNLAYRLDYRVRPHEIYYNQMMSNVQVITPEKKDFAFRVYHVFRPYYKSRMRECFFKYEDKILNNITQFRDFKNNNCYIFNYYDYVNGYSDKFTLSHHYASISEAEDCIETIRNKKFDTTVVNDDVDEIPDDVYNELINAFEMHFSEPSKYELGTEEAKVQQKEIEVEKANSAPMLRSNSLFAVRLRQREKLKRLINVLKKQKY